MFVASGHVGRTTISCDDGRTWVGNRSDEDGFTCFVAGGNPDGGSEDCDHNAGAGHGVVFSNGWFIASYGWGPPGGIRRSADGVNWTQTLSGTTFQGVVEGGGLVFASGRNPRWSRDDGATWDAGSTIDLRGADGGPIYNVRAQGRADGVFVVFGNDSDRSDLRVSRDDGATWVRPTSLPPECRVARRFGSNGGTLLFLTDQGLVCRSVDRGDTFSASDAGGLATEGVEWTGTEFLAWGTLRPPSYTPVAFRSTDGERWTATPLIGRRPDGGVGRPELGAVSRSPLTGTFVSVRGTWQNWYARQEFYRSTDGVTWDFLPAGAFVGSHPLHDIAFGSGAPSAACP